MDHATDSPLLCHRCGAELRPGHGNFYVVRIEAVADPSPPDLDPEDLQRDLDSEIAKAIEAARNLSQQELMDQVYHRATIYLCARCYGDWIEDPAR